MGVKETGLPRVIHGPGCVAALSVALDELGVERALIVTGRTIASLPLVDIVVQAAGPDRVRVFPGAREHAPRSAVIEGLEAYRTMDARAIISVGGSSPLDVARGIGLLHRAGGDLGALGRASAEAAVPLVAVSTTLSQGEFTEYAGITDERTGYKELIADEVNVPRRVFLDGQLAMQTPEPLWSSTGVKALDTAIDRFVAGGPDPYRDALSVAAIARLTSLLPAPATVENRQDLQVAAWMAIYPYRNLPAAAGPTYTAGRLGNVLRHQLGALTGSPHGILSCVLLVQCLRFHLPDLGERQEQLARALGYASARNLHSALESLVATLGLPRSLVPADLSPSLIDTVVEHALREEPAFAPRASEVRRLLEQIARA